MNRLFVFKNIANAAFILFAAFIFSASTVQAQPIASFSANPTVGCVPLTVDFTDNSINANSYFWDFGNGNTSTLQNPTSVYLSPGFYTVMLVAINTTSGQRDTFIAVNYIHTVPAPATNFSAAPTTACQNGTAIVFNNTTSGAVSYTWDFGDGTTSTLQNPVHAYSNPGNYTVKLIATNGFGCSNIHIKNNYITIRPKPSFSFSAQFTSSCNPSDVFSFSATGSGVTSWLWNFGDGSTSTQQNPSHTYGSTGAFTVTLIGTNSFGCSDTIIQTNYINIGNALVPSFNVSNAAGCNSLTTTFTPLVQNAISWFWNFGDGTTSTLQNPTHTYASPGNYTVTLTVNTASGCNGTASYPNAIAVDPLPVANFTVALAYPCDAYSFQFTNTSVNGVTYLWEFGDGSISTSVNPIHTYSGGNLYSVTLHAYSANGCESVITKTNVIDIQKYFVNFTGTPRTGCKPLDVSFTALTNYPGTNSWQWTFGDGTTSSLQNPTHTYTNNGNYNVKLKISSSFGCTDSVTKNAYIKVVPGNVNYTVPDTIINCTPFPISFSNPLIGADYALWNFGNGDSSNAINGSYVYTVAGTYVVTLFTSMPGGCSQLFNPFAIVQVYDFLPDPILILSSTNCKPWQFQFTNNTPDIVSYVWNFGDGTTDTIQNPVHIYTQPGTYSVSVTLTNIYGCVKTVTTQVVVGHPNPIHASSLSQCSGDPVQFTLGTPSAFASYVWNFGDGTPTSTLQNPSHVYANTGNYIVQLITLDNLGCRDTFYSDTLRIRTVSAGFMTTDPRTGCNSLTVHFTNTSSGAISYLWNFGDGTTDVLTSPMHTYNTPGTYTVTLTASNLGCTKSSTQNNYITVYQALVDFIFSSSGNCFPISVSYTDQSLNPVSWLWNFGDGQTSTLQNPVHIFNNQPGGPVSLTVTDANGCTGTQSKPNIAGVPIKAFVLDTLGCRPFQASFTDSTQNATSWLWNFGDGTTSALQNPVHNYTSAGIFTIQLTVTLSSGCTSTITLPNQVYVIKPAPDFTSPTPAVCAPSLVQFNDLSSNAVAWFWDFGDGTSSAAQHPSHIYNIPGDYTISLRIWDSLGCTAIIVKTDFVHVPGTYAYFTLTSQLNCLNTFVQFVDSSINATSWTWNFGDGYTSTLQNPSHLYQDTGSYIVSLIASDSLGCTSYFTFPDPIVVHPAPFAGGSITSAVQGCSPFTATFANSSTGATAITWHFGDGDTSNLNNPIHTYNHWGNYNAYIVAINQFGCSDTLFMPVPVIVDKTPKAQFTATPGNGCEPLPVQFNNSSQALQNPTYSWNFGNGQTSTQQNPSQVYTQAGNYFISLIVVNDNGCMDSVIQSVSVLPSPVASASILDTAGCSPYTVHFNNSSQNAVSYIWNFGDGSTSNLPSPVYTYSTSGVYYPALIAIGSNGCTDTLHLSDSVIVKQSPAANFSATITSGCSGNDFILQNNSTGLVNAVFSWQIGPFTSTLPNPVVNLITPGFYTVSLTVTNENGCSDSISKSNYLLVADTLPPPITPIYSVSVLNNTSVEIKWAPSAAQDLKEYRLFRYNTSTSAYQLIYTLLDTNNANPILNPSYIETGLNTLQNVYTYKVQVVDMCNYALSLSQSQAHTTINVTAQANGTSIMVTWTPYIGCPVSNYEINRYETETGLNQFLGSVPPNTLSFHDQSLNCPFKYSYRITARDLCGNPFTSLSDTSIATPENSLANQQVEIVRSTVIFNKSILTEWNKPSLAPDRVIKYNILRSTDKYNYSLIASVPSTVTHYIDDRVDVDEQQYFYKVDPVNDCNLSGLLSVNSSSILLQSDWKDQKTKLLWTPYDQWDNGVDYYIIEKKNEAGQWVQVKIVNGIVTETELDE